MNDTQLILTALSQVPDLVEAGRSYKEVNDKAINTISIAVKKQHEAIIPDICTSLFFREWLLFSCLIWLSMRELNQSDISLVSSECKVFVVELLKLLSIK